MSMYWEGTPSFAGGQVLSASAHLNQLVKATSMLHDRLVGFQMPFCGHNNRWGARRYPNWFFRHKYPKLRYKVYHSGKAASFTISNDTIFYLADNQNGWFEGEIDLTSRNIALNSIYCVQANVADQWESFQVWLLAEKNDGTTGYPALPSFADGTYPTTADWNNLSAYAEQLHRDTVFPVPPSVGNMSAGDAQFPAWIGAFVHGGGKLNYKWQVRTGDWTGRDSNPAIGEKHNHATAQFRIHKYNQLGTTSTIISQCDMHDKWMVGWGPGMYWDEKNRVWKIPDSTYDPAGIGIQVGDIYFVSLDVDIGNNACPACMNDGGAWQLLHCYEVPDSNTVVPGYVSMHQWQNGDYPGSYGGTGVDAIRNNLIAIKNHNPGLNFPTTICPEWNRSSDWNGWGVKDDYHKMVRRHRWLWYLGQPRNYGNEPTQVTLKWTRGRWESDVIWHPEMNGYTQLPITESYSQDCSPDEWRKINLDDCDGLYPGMPYVIKGAHIAFEDDDA